MVGLRQSDGVGSKVRHAVTRSKRCYAAKGFTLLDSEAESSQHGCCCFRSGPRGGR